MGINGNEKADKLAKEGTKQQSTIKNKIRVSDAIWAFQIKAHTEANRWYTVMSTTKGKKFYRYQTTLNKKMWHYKLKIPPKDIKILNRLIAGHDYSNFWLHKMKLTDKVVSSK